MHSSTRAAFTLVELLVVIAIIGILIALLLPAVQVAREAARRAQCLNHLKQIGLGLHNYHAAARSFPPGKITEGLCCSTKSRTNWAIALLPYLEQQALADAYDHNAYNEDLGLNGGNKLVRESLVSTYVCPSDIGGDEIDVPNSGPGGSWMGQTGIPYRRGSYRGVAGRVRNGIDDEGAFWDSINLRVEGSKWPLPHGWRGVLHLVGMNGLTTESVNDITDGTSNTLMVGERATENLRQWGTFWAYSYGYYNTSHGIPHSSTLLVDLQRCRDTVIYPPLCCNGWGSFHPDVIPFALCDGSVRAIGTDIDMNLFCDLCTIAGGEVVRLP